MTSISYADFGDAQKQYTVGNYPEAFNEFLTLAKFGNIKSQHNVAVMLSEGQGVEKDLI
jgi:TPR repeat protein